MSKPGSNVNKLTQVKESLKSATTVEEISYVLNEHISYGNTKLADHVAIFNMNSAHDCPNAKTKENGESQSGLCQVAWEDCYAAQSENTFPRVIDYRRRQEFIWNYLTAEEFANAFLKIVERKTKPVTALRLSEAGDFRNNHDIQKAETITERLRETKDIAVYTYSASHKLNWDIADYLKVMQSNEKREYGDASYQAVESTEEIPENGIHCPNNMQKINDADNPVKCGDCRLCIDKNNVDVYTVIS